MSAIAGLLVVYSPRFKSTQKISGEFWRRPDNE